MWKVVAAWLVVLMILSWHGDSPLAELYIWGTLAFLAYKGWEKAQPALKAQARAKVEAEVEQWRAESVPSPGPELSETCAPLTVPLRPAARGENPQEALRELSGAVVRHVAGEVLRHAERLAALPPDACGPGIYREREGRDWSAPRTGTRPSPEAAAALYGVIAWGRARTPLLKLLRPEAGARLDADARGLEAELSRLRSSGDRVSKGRGEVVCPAGDWEKYLSRTKKWLRETGASLGALDAESPIAEIHPPRFARIKDTVAADTLARQINRFLRNQDAPRAGRALADWQAAESRSESQALSGFLTDEIPRKYSKIGFRVAAAARLGAQSASPELRAAIYWAFRNVQLAYLKEVMDHMDDYTRQSGRERPVTVIGNVGLVNGNANGSTINVASNLNIGGAGGETNGADLAEVVRVLTAAIRDAAELGERDRTDLLDHVADVSDAAAAPGDRRKLLRAKAALTTVVAAAGSAGQVAQAAQDCMNVVGRLL
ncbi:hypothetical protein [Actinomadura atramentaria]|uniref:hypothetical protein n=1 Tax=Actinomadura atramentaria TaxID=1990 RepID=UPI000367D06F|nr:hypothetical protein [Actinomadura atramentaria]